MGLLDVVGKSIGVLGGALASVTSSTVSAACDLAPKASSALVQTICKTAEAGGELIKIGADIATRKKQ